MSANDAPARMGHEFIGIIEDVGRHVTTLKKRDLVVSSFAVSDGTWDFCHEHLQTSGVNGRL
jgi:Zn-dependent alcohol dehydrogenase